MYLKISAMNEFFNPKVGIRMKQSGPPRLAPHQKAEQVFFIYGITFKKNESGRDFQLGQIWNDRSQKQKKNYGSHPIRPFLTVKVEVAVQLLYRYLYKLLIFAVLTVEVEVAALHFVPM
jgi:hypothetical protein